MTKEIFILVEVPYMDTSLPVANIADVFLNSGLQKFCIYADAEEGWIQRMKLDKNNEPIIVNKVGIVTEVVYGDVKIRIPCKSLSEFELFVNAYFSECLS